MRKIFFHATGGLFHSLSEVDLERGASDVGEEFIPQINAGYFATLDAPTEVESGVDLGNFKSSFGRLVYGNLGNLGNSLLFFEEKLGMFLNRGRKQLNPPLKFDEKIPNMMGCLKCISFQISNILLFWVSTVNFLGR